MDPLQQVNVSQPQNPPNKEIPAVNKKRNFWSLKISNNDDALAMVKESSNLALFLGIISILFAGFLFFIKDQNWWSALVDTAIYIILFFLLRKSKNRTSAITFLIVVILSAVDTFINKITLAGGSNIFLAAIALVGAVKAVKATFYLHKGEALSKKLLFTVAFFSLIASCLILLEIWPAVFMSPILRFTLYSKEKHPTLYEFPQERPISLANYKPKQPEEISHFGLSLKSPWGKPFKSMKWGVNDWVFFYKNPVHGILFHPPNEPPILSIQSMRDTDPRSKELGRILGEDVLSSNYLLHMTLLNTDPNTLNITASPRQLVTLGIVLPLKETLILGSPYIYTFNYNNLKGYQISVKGKSDSSAVLTLFDTRDNVYTLSISNSPTQEEVDYIISTIKIDPTFTLIP